MVTFETMSLQRRLTFGDPFQGSGVVGTVAVFKRERTCTPLEQAPQEAPVRLTRAVQRVRAVLRISSCLSSSKNPPVLPNVLGGG